MSDDLTRGLWMVSGSPYRRRYRGGGCGCLGLFLELVIIAAVIRSGLWLPIVVIGLVVAYLAAVAERRGG